MYSIHLKFLILNLPFPDLKDSPITYRGLNLFSLNCSLEIKPFALRAKFSLPPKIILCPKGSKPDLSLETLNRL